MVGSVGQGQEWGLCPGDTERVSVAEVLDSEQTVVLQARGHNQKGDKAA